MTTQEDLRLIGAWCCDVCGYWRQEYTTGIHTAPNPDNPNGALLSHPLSLRIFVESARLAKLEADLATCERLWLRGNR